MSRNCVENTTAVLSARSLGMDDAVKTGNLHFPGEPKHANQKRHRQLVGHRSVYTLER